MQSNILTRVFGAALALWLGACTMEGSENETPEPFVPDSEVTPPVEPTVPAQERRFRIFHTNDEHSHLLGFGPESEYPWLPSAAGTVDATVIGTIATKIANGYDDQTVGGFVRRQYLVNKLRAESAAAGVPTLLLSAGDATMGTVWHVAGSQGAPDFLAMALLGYDFMTLGNHEFDWGPGNLAATIAAAQRITFSGMPTIVASNVQFGDLADTDSGKAIEAIYGEGDSGAPIVPWATRVLPNGLHVGFFGLFGYEAALESMSLGGLRFSTPAGGAVCSSDDDCDGLSCQLGHCVNVLDEVAHVTALAGDAQRMVNLLRDEQGVDVVVAITHAGELEDAFLAAYTSGIDVIIGGHSHTQLVPEVIESQVGSGQTILVQAGNYGAKLGDLTIVVDEEGAVSFDAGASTLHDVDSTLDADIFAGTDLGTGTLSPAFEQALGITGSVIGPVYAGLNGELAAAIGLGTVLDPVVYGTYDVIGPVGSTDSNLMHLVTDANAAIAGGGMCRGGDTSPIIAVQANGVLRDDLQLGNAVDPADNLDGLESASFADVFRVVPLGASPFEVNPTTGETGPYAAPGLPLVTFKLDGVSLFAGMDIGVTKGLQSNAFFLGYGGAKVTYDPTRSAFDPSQLGVGDPGGAVTKIEVGAWVVYDLSRDSANWFARWRLADGTPFDPTNDPDNGLFDTAPATFFTILTNLYIAGFMDAFGITPRGPTGAPIAGASSAERLAQTVLCQNPAATGDCTTPSPRVFSCTGVGLTPPWAAPELKEWQALLTYLTSPVALGGVLPAALYEGTEPVGPRVIPVE